MTADTERAREERALSDAYLRLRALIPGAYDTPTAPTREQVWATTEAALRRLLQGRDDAEAILAEINSPEIVEYALEVWRDSLLLKTWSDADRMKSVLGHVSRSAIEAVLARRQNAGDRPDVEIRHPLTRATWVLDGRTGRTKEVVPATDDLERARREERELCARRIEARAVAIRDHGSVSAAGLLTALAGAQVGCLLEAAASLRAARDAAVG